MGYRALPSASQPAVQRSNSCSFHAANSCPTLATVAPRAAHARTAPAKATGRSGFRKNTRPEGPESVSELGQGWVRWYLTSQDFLLLVHPIPCNLGPPLPPVQCGYHVAFHCPPVAAPKSRLHSNGGQGRGDGPAHFGRGDGLGGRVNALQGDLCPLGRPPIWGGTYVWGRFSPVSICLS